MSIKYTVESDLSFCFNQSILEIRGDVYHLELGSDYVILNAGTEIIVPFREIKKYIDLLIIDGNQIPHENSVFLNHLKKVKELDIGIVVDIPDCYFSQNGLEKILFWSERSNCVVVHNARFQELKDRLPNLAIWPGIPLGCNAYLNTWEDKSATVGFFGSNHRQRDLFSAILKKNGLAYIAGFHGRRQTQNVLVNYSEYINALKNCQMVFSNGYITMKESIIVGRAIETMASGSLLLYESGSDLGLFYNEYKHFIPIKNLHDFVEKVRFFYNEPETGKAIAAEAQRFHRITYGPNAFWNQIKNITFSN